MPVSVPGADACTPLDPTIDAPVPKADFDCLTAKIAGGRMTGFAVPPCGAAGDFACASAGSGLVADTYHAAAARGSLADHFFQSTLDGPEQNLIYLSKTAHGVDLLSESGRHVTRLMAEEGVRWALYLDDRDHTAGQRPPEFYDAHWTHFRSVDELDRDVELQQLPAVSIVIPAVSDSEQPGQGPAQVGLELAHHVWQTVLGAPAYASSTLVLSTFLSSGGYFDHVAPPAAPPLTIDENLGEPVDYGPRVPLLALGPFARVNHISHVPLELSSLTVFLEWNWLRAGSGVLGQRDTTAANLGSLLEPARTGVVVPP
jgi:hypothetical protein